MTQQPILFGAAAAISIFAGPEDRAAALPAPALGQISFERSTTLDGALARRLALRIVGADGVLRGLSIAAVDDTGAEFTVSLDQNFSEFQREVLIDRIATQLDIPRDKVRVVRATPGSVNATVVLLPPDAQGAQQVVPVVTLAGIATATTDAKQLRFDTLVRDLNDKLAAGELDLGAGILGEPAVVTGLVNTPAPLIVQRWFAGTCGGEAAAEVPLLQGPPRVLLPAPAPAQPRRLEPVAWGGPGVVGGEAITGLTQVIARVDDLVYAPELGQGGAGALLAVGAAAASARAAALALGRTPPCAAYSTDLGNTWRSAGPLLLSGRGRAAAHSAAQRRVLVVGEGALGGLAASVFESVDLRTWNVVSAADSPESALGVDASLPDPEAPGGGEPRVQWIVGGEAEDPARRIRQCTDAAATEWQPIAYPAASLSRATAVLHAPDRVRVQDDRLPRWVVVGDGPAGFLCGPAGRAVAHTLDAGTHGYDLSLALTSVDYGTDASGALLFVACGWGESSSPAQHPSPCAIFTSTDGQTWAGVPASAALFPPGARPARVAFGAADRAWAVLAPGGAPQHDHTLAVSADGAATWSARAFAGAEEGGAAAAAPLAPLLRPLELNAQPAGADLANFAAARAAPGQATALRAGDKRAAAWTGAAAAREPAQGDTLLLRDAARVEAWRSDDAAVTWAPAALATPLPPRRMAAAAGVRWPASPLGVRLVVAGGQDASRGADPAAGQLLGAALADVWASDDGGESWQQLAAAAPWGARRGHALVGLSGELLLLGGQRAATGAVLNDVWASQDGGAEWTLVNAAADWPPRFGHAAAAPQRENGGGNGSGTGAGPVYVLAGCDASGTPLPAAEARVWRSVDGGLSWEQRGNTPPYGARAHAAAAMLPTGAILLLGGEDQDGRPLGDQWVSDDGGASWVNNRATGETGAGLPSARRGAALALADRTEPITRTTVRELYLLGGEGRADVWRAQLTGSNLFWRRLAEDAGAGPRLGAALVAIPTPTCGCPDKLRLVGGELPIYDRRLLISADGGGSWAEALAEAAAELPQGEAAQAAARRLAHVPAASARREQLRGRTRALAAAPDRMVLAVGDRGAATLAPPPHLDPAGGWAQAGDPDAPPLANKRLVAAAHIAGTGRFVAVATDPTLLDLEEEGPLDAALAAGPPAAPAFGAAAALLRADILDGSSPAQLGPWNAAALVLAAPLADGVRWRAVAHSPQLGRMVAVGWGGAGGGDARVLWSEDGGGTWSGQGVAGVPDAGWWSVAWSAEKGRFVAVGPGATPRTRRLVRQGAAAFDTPQLNPAGRRARVMLSEDGKAWREPAGAQPAAPLAAVLWSPREGVFLALTAEGGRGRERAILSPDGDRWLRAVREEGRQAQEDPQEDPQADPGGASERATAIAYAPGARAMCMVGRRAPLRSGRALTADTILNAGAPLYAWSSPADPADPAGALPAVTLGFEPDSRTARFFQERLRAGLELRGSPGLPTPLSGPGLLVRAPSPLHDAVLAAGPPPPGGLPDLRLYFGTQDTDPQTPLVDADGARPVAEALGWPARILAARFVAESAQAALYAPLAAGQVNFARPAAAGTVDAFPTALAPPENPFPFALGWDTRRLDLSLSEYYLDCGFAEAALLYQDALARRSRDAWVGLGAEPAGVARFRALDVPDGPLAQLFDPAAGPVPDTLDLILGFPPPRDAPDDEDLTHTTGAWAADLSGAPLDQPGAAIFDQLLPEDAPAPPAYPRRSAHAAFALGAGAHLLVGGLGTTQLLADAWLSGDGGATWAEVDPSPGPSPQARAHAAHALWRGADAAGAAHCILAGGVGHGLQRLADVWATADAGAAWTLATAAAPWGERRAAAMVALAPDRGGAGSGAELILAGGELLGTDASGNPAPRYQADVWASADGGATWHTRAQGCPWGGRAEMALAAMPAHTASAAQPAPALVLTGGMRNGTGRTADTWVSLDRGATWARQPDPPPAQPTWSARRGHAMVATADQHGTLLLLAGGEGQPATRSATLTCPFCDLWYSRDLGATWTNVPNINNTWSARFHHRMALDETSPTAALLLTGGFLAVALFAVDTYFSRGIAGARGWDPFLLGVRLRFSNADAAKMLPIQVGGQDLEAIFGGTQQLRIVRVDAETD